MSRHVLDSQVGWRIGRAFDVAAGEAVRLASHPVAPRPITDPSGALGGLAGPIWAVAVDETGLLVILDRRGERLLAYDPCLERFDPIPCLGGPGRSIGELSGARGLAIVCGRLLVADTGNRRVQAVDLASSRVSAVWGPFAMEGGRLRPVRGMPALDATGLPTGDLDWPAGTWEPTAVLARADGTVVVADRTNSVLHVFASGRPVATLDGAAPDGSRIVAPVALVEDRDGRIVVVQEGIAAVRVLDRDGAFAEDVTLPDDLVAAFGPPAVTVDADGTIWISHRTTGPCYRVCRSSGGRCLPPERVRLVPPHCPLLAFDRDGNAILGDGRQPCLMRASERAFAPVGTAVTEPLDSRLPGCVWDTVALDLDLPFGTRLAVETFTADAAWTLDEVLTLPDSRWRRTEAMEGGAWECAVRSAPGRYLWLRLTLSGDGATTPEIARIEASFPRETWRRHLPAALALDPDAADFLDRFLMIFERVREDYTDILDDLPGLFDPLATPAADPGAPGRDFLDWLASWIGLALERQWPVEARRRLVKEAAALYRLRGTPEGLKRHVALYTGLEPRLVEHFRLRAWMALGYGALGADAALWGPDVVARLQLDVFSEIGRFALVDTGDPVADPFGAFAHRATLVVPVDDTADGRTRATIERIVALAAPGHAEITVQTVDAGFRLDCNAILGSTTRLGCPPDRIALGETPLDPPARLGGEPHFAFGPGRGGARLGTETRLHG